MSGRSYYRGPASYRRGRPQFPSSGKAFLIVTEGEKTEPNYFKALRSRLQLNVAEVEIVHPGGTDPITLTRHAINMRDARRKASRKSSFYVPYDEVWVVFDLEKPHDQRRRLAQQAMAMPEAAGINFGISDPAFEYWLLLHFEYTTAPFSSCAAVLEYLKKHLPKYSKGGHIDSGVLSRIPEAIMHAERCARHHLDVGGDGNPSTNVADAVRQLNCATRRHLRFILT